MKILMNAAIGSRRLGPAGGASAGANAVVIAIDLAEDAPSGPVSAASRRFGVAPPPPVCGTVSEIKSGAKRFDETMRMVGPPPCGAEVRGPVLPLKPGAKTTPGPGVLAGMKPSTASGEGVDTAACITEASASVSVF